MNHLIIRLVRADGCGVCGGEGLIQVTVLAERPERIRTIRCPACWGPSELVVFLGADAAGAA